MPTSFRRPFRDAKLAVLLPVSSTTPQLIWNSRDRHCYINSSNNLVHARIFPIGLQNLVHDVFVTKNEHGLDHSVVVDYQSNSFYNPSEPPNPCIRAITTNNHKDVWRGPAVIRSIPGLLVMHSKQKCASLVKLMEEERCPSLIPDFDEEGGYEKGYRKMRRVARELLAINPWLRSEYAQFEEKKGDYQDLTVADFRIAIAFFEKGGILIANKYYTPSLATVSETTVTGVRINCLADLKMGFQPKECVEFMIPRSHKIFAEWPTDISRHMGIPLIVMKLPPHAAWKHRTLRGLGYNPWENYKAVYLNGVFGLESNCWGFSDMIEYDLRPGSVVVVRADRKDLCPKQIEALGDFCHFGYLCDARTQFREDLEAMKRDFTSEEMSNLRAKFLKEHLNQAVFEVFFDKLKRRKIEAGDSSWASAVSPYSV